MENPINWLQAEVSEIEGDRLVYSLDKVREVSEVTALPEGACVAIQRSDQGHHWIKFAVLRWAYEDEGVDKFEVVFHGEGASGNLRECRHTWWGEDGYVFYPDGRVISAAFKELSKYFDGMSD